MNSMRKKEIGEFSPQFELILIGWTWMDKGMKKTILMLKSWFGKYEFQNHQGSCMRSSCYAVRLIWPRMREIGLNWLYCVADGSCWATSIILKITFMKSGVNWLFSGHKWSEKSGRGKKMEIKMMPFMNNPLHTHY